MCIRDRSWDAIVIFAELCESFLAVFLHHLAYGAIDKAVDTLALSVCMSLIDVRLSHEVPFVLKRVHISLNVKKQNGFTCWTPILKREPGASFSRPALMQTPSFL